MKARFCASGLLVLAVFLAMACSAEAAFSGKWIGFKMIMTQDGKEQVRDFDEMKMPEDKRGSLEFKDGKAYMARPGDNNRTALTYRADGDKLAADVPERWAKDFASVEMQFEGEFLVVAFVREERGGANPSAAAKFFLKALPIAAGPGNTEDDPVVVTTPAELAAIGASKESLGKYYRLGGDIDLNNEPWTPIGRNGAPFTGTFDGGGNVISGLSITGRRSDVGLFGYVDAGGVVKNLGVSGSVAGGNRNKNIGGLVGNNSGRVSNCHFAGSVTGEGDMGDTVGGIVGFNFGAVEYCYNTGAVAGEGNSVGGVAGSNNGGVISNCYNTGDVSGRNHIGGVVSGNYQGTVEYCYNTGSVSGKGSIGGVLSRLHDASVLRLCVSLGPAVTAADNDAHVRRVAAYIDDNCIIFSNKARADMKVFQNTSEPVAAVSDPEGVHGADVPIGAPMREVFSGWSEEVWNIPAGNLTKGAALPTLKSAPQAPAPVLP